MCNTLIGFHTQKNYLHLYDCPLQFFLGSPYSYASTNTTILESIKSSKIFIHSKYVGNISNPHSSVTVRNLKKEIIFLDKSNISHCGSIVHLSTPANGNDSIKTVVKALNVLCDTISKLKLLHKNYIIIETSNIISHLGSTIDDLALIYNSLSKLGKSMVRFCVDTAHIFNTYYAIDSVRGIVDYFAMFDFLIGLDKLIVVHLNDSDGKPLSSTMPHKAIGNGNIFKDYNNTISSLHILKSICSLYNIPCILERGVIKDSLEPIQRELNLYTDLDISGLDISNLMSIINDRKILYLFYKMYDLYSKINDKKMYTYLKAIKSLSNQPLKVFNYTMKSKPVFIDTEYNVITFYTQIKHVGESLAKNIYEIISNNTFTKLKELNNKINTLSDLLKIPFIGYITADKLYNIGIKNATKLFNNRIDLLNSGVIDTLQVKSIEHYLKIKPLARSFVDLFKSHLNLEGEWYILGSYVRGHAILNDIDLLVVDIDIDKVLKAINKIAIYVTDFRKGSTMYSGIYKIDKTYFWIDICKVTETEKYTAIQYFTGSKEFNIKLRSIAKSKKMLLNQYGLFNNSGEAIHLSSEKDIFDNLNIKYIQPNKRDVL